MPSLWASSAAAGRAVLLLECTVISKGNRFGHYPRVPGIAAAAVDRVKRAGSVYGGGASIYGRFASIFLPLYIYLPKGQYGLPHASGTVHSLRLAG